MRKMHYALNSHISVSFCLTRIAFFIVKSSFVLANNTAFSVKQVQDYAGHSDYLTTFPVPNSNTIPVAVHTDYNYQNP